MAGKALEAHITKDQRLLTYQPKASERPHTIDATQPHQVVDAVNHEDSDVQNMLTESNKALDAMRLSLLEIHQKQEQHFVEQITIMNCTIHYRGGIYGT